MASEKPTVPPRPGPSWRVFSFALMVFAAGLAVGILIGSRPAPEDPRRTPDAPDEIAIHVPNGHGGHDSTRFAISAVHTEGDVQGELPADATKVTLFYFPPGGVGKVRTVAYRCTPR